MKTAKIFIVGILIYTSIAAIAATKQADYSKVKKDISVMAQIVSSAFKDTRACDDCGVQVDTNYLADQGAVFTFKSYSFQGLGRFGVPHVSPISREHAMNIEELVGDVLAGVGETLEDVGAEIEMRFDDQNHEHEFDDDSHVMITRSTRSSARQLNREIRELEYQVRESEIQLIHAEDDEARKEVENEIRGLEEAIVKLENKKSEINEKYETDRKARAETRRIRRERETREELERLDEVQDVVIQTFCDYGSTLKNLPDDEHVSIVIKRKRQEGDAVFVLKKKHIENCNDGVTLKKQAMSYFY